MGFRASHTCTFMLPPLHGFSLYRLFELGVWKLNGGHVFVGRESAGVSRCLNLSDKRTRIVLVPWNIVFIFIIDVLININFSKTVHLCFSIQYSFFNWLKNWFIYYNYFYKCKLVLYVTLNLFLALKREKNLNLKNVFFWKISKMFAKFIILG